MDSRENGNDVGLCDYSYTSQSRLMPMAEVSKDRAFCQGIMPYLSATPLH